MGIERIAHKNLKWVFALLAFFMTISTLNAEAENNPQYYNF